MPLALGEAQLFPQGSPVTLLERRADRKELGEDELLSVKSADSDYKTALQGWSDHLESCEVCGSVENDGTLEEALPELCAEGRTLAEAEIAADAAAIAAMRAKAGSDVRSVPAHELEPEMVTSDGQEILDVEWIEGGHVLYHVFTPSDDEAENEERKAAPEARGAAFGERVAILKEEAL